MGRGRRIVVVVLFAAALFLLSHSSLQAARFSGQYFLHVCASDANGNELVEGGHAVCQAYISGILDYHSLIRSLGTAPGIDFCVPEETGLYEIQHKVGSYMFRNRDSHEKFIASPGVALGLFSAYPCEK